MLWTRYDVFVSYSREDGARVRPLVDELRRQGYRVFFDVESIVVGERWKERLERSIRASRVLVLCWSEHARVSEFVQFEFSLAKGLRKPVLPWLLDQTPLPKMVEVQGISAAEATQVAAALQPQLGWTLARRRSLQGLVAALLVAVLAFAVGRGMQPGALRGKVADVTANGKAPVSSSGKSATPSPTEVASREKMAFPLPDKPSIAVLPFVNMSGEKEQEYFSDGLTEDIINALAKTPGVFVIARNSSFTYKGKNVKVQQVAEELGVQYVLEGSVQKTANKVRVTAQLVDALTGRHLMSEQYERDLKDIFALQDELTMKVRDAIGAALFPGRTWRDKGTKSLAAYLKTMQASQLAWARKEESLAQSKRLAEEAIALDPKYAWPYAVIAADLAHEVRIGHYKDPREALEKARKFGEKAVALDDSNAFAHATLSEVLVVSRDYDRAIAEAQRAADLEPGSSMGMGMLAECLNWSGQYAQSIPLLQKALRLSPGTTGLLSQLGISYQNLGRYQEAIAAWNEAVHRDPDRLTSRVPLAATYMLAGREPEARAEVAEILRINPTFSIEQFANANPMKDRTAVRDRLIEPLRKAGLK